MKVGKLLNIFSLGLLIYNWIYCITNYSKLPQTIPIHFNFAGEADGFGDKIIILLFPSIATIIFFMYRYFRKNPKSPFLNIPQSIKKDKGLIYLLIEIINILSVILFLNITYETITYINNNLEKIGNNTLLIVATLVITIILFTIYSKKSKKLI